VRVYRGGAARWTEIRRVWIGDGDRAGFRVVQRARAYDDRLVLKLEGVDDASAAAGLRGWPVAVAAEDAPALEEGEHYSALLVGLQVIDEHGGTVGRVTDVMPTGGADLLVVEGSTGGEILIPFAPGIVEHVDEAEGVIRIRPPEGLLELNRGD